MKLAKIKKLGIEIKDKVYTHYELEVLNMELSAYYIDEDMSEEELEFTKDLAPTGVNREEYNRLLEKISILESMFIY